MSDCKCKTCNCSIGKPDAALVACTFCQKDLYCSEDCKQLGWSIHQDDCNVWEAPETNVTVFLDKNDKTNHIVRHVNPSGYIEQHVVIGDSIASNTKCEEPSKDGKYSIQIELNGEEICNLEGKELLENSIYTSALGTAGKIAKSKEFTPQNPLVLWPGKLSENPQEDCGLIRVKILNENGKLISSIAGLYDLEDVTAVHLPAKNLRNAQVLKARDANENYCELTFVDQKLADVEYHLSSLDPLVNGTTKFQSEKIEFMCDPRDIDHVNGLIMAMEDKGGAAKFHQFDIINQYREGLEAGTVDGPSPKINGAIQMAQRELWELVSAPKAWSRFWGAVGKSRASSAREKREINQIKRKKLTQEQFDAKFRQLLDELASARQQNLVGSTQLNILKFMIDQQFNLGYKVDPAMKAEFDKYWNTEKLSKTGKREGQRQMQSYE